MSYITLCISSYINSIFISSKEAKCWWQCQWRWSDVGSNSWWNSSITYCSSKWVKLVCKMSAQDKLLTHKKIAQFEYMWDVALCSLWKLTLVQNDNNSLRNIYGSIWVCDLDKKHLIVLLLNNLILNDWHLHADTVITIDGEWAKYIYCSVVRAGCIRYRKGWCLRYSWHCLWMK